MANQQMITFEELQAMYNGTREYPVNERGMLQLIECCEREMSKIKDERSKVNRYAAIIRDSIKNLLKRLDECRNGELLPFDGQDEQQEEQNIGLDTRDWRDTVEMEKAKKNETFSPDDDPDGDDDDQLKPDA